MNELTLSTDINIITAEINSYKNVAGQAIFEIGKRLEHAKNELFKEKGYGEFDKWCNKDLDMTRQTVNRFIKAHKELGTTSFQLGSGKIFEILQLPENVDKQEFITQQHSIPSSGEKKTVDEMTVRELREVKKVIDFLSPSIGLRDFSVRISPCKKGVSLRKLLISLVQGYLHEPSLKG
ncbi:DUF3102 domain-containing protein [Bacillus sp. AFS017336]|uniref:DUF3102 domain-containing protein n=1 Tax=Bacillus sp. AFS017336 TaxID=2033489 RepID=UPI000BEFE85E|nr:DUF3102 domain-containing protein [Bacillus sp. AFS017336]PEL13772.1 hypothetical protein CN601_03405 [Bacillus sp. AFS017336]